MKVKKIIRKFVNLYLTYNAFGYKALKVNCIFTHGVGICFTCIYP